MGIYPDWVMKYKEKGTYINKVNNKYYLYAAHSERIKGTKKVRRVSDGYLGRITEKDGLIPPKDKVSAPVISYEYGISYIVISCTSNIRSGLRRSFSKYGDLVYSCSILMFLYGVYDRELFEQSFLYLYFADLAYPDTFTDAQIFGIERSCRMITDAMMGAFGDDLPLIKAHFSNIRILKINKKTYVSELSSAAQVLSEKYKLDWSDTSWQK